MKRKDIEKKKIPSTPGVYFFLGPKRGEDGSSLRKRILYIGKAGSLSDRVRSYFAKDLFVTRGPAIERMIEEARDVVFQKTDSVLEALILEAKLIKKHKPKYNVRDKDDKSFNYVVITDEDFPIVKIMRGKDLNANRPTLNALFGPFPEGRTLKEALRIVRKIFPFRDSKCSPAHYYSGILQNTKIVLRPCFSRQIGLCPGTCTGEVTKNEYQKTIRNIRLLFKGKKGVLIKTLEREMKQAAKAHEFEKAVMLRNKVFSLKHLRDIALLKHEKMFLRDDTSFLRGSAASTRIEAYDVAHLSGGGMVGVMVVVLNGEPSKNEYRKFILKTISSPNDPGALKEIFERRLRHTEWRLPDLVVVDGGKAQIRVVEKLLQPARHASQVGAGGGQTFARLNKVSRSGGPARLRRSGGLDRVIPVVGVVKNEYHKPKRIEGEKSIVRRHEREIVLANSEAHRFAIKFHRQQIRKKFL